MTLPHTRTSALSRHSVRTGSRSGPVPARCGPVPCVTWLSLIFAVASQVAWARSASGRSRARAREPRQTGHTTATDTDNKRQLSRLAATAPRAALQSTERRRVQRGASRRRKSTAFRRADRRTGLRSIVLLRLAGRQRLGALCAVFVQGIQQARRKKRKD
jgi:hypothetical protein